MRTGRYMYVEPEMKVGYTEMFEFVSKILY